MVAKSAIMSKLDWWFAQNIIGSDCSFKNWKFDALILILTILQMVFAQMFLLIKKAPFLEKGKHKEAKIAAINEQIKTAINWKKFS